jgi:AcrR family transcriptional regulator
MLTKCHFGQKLVTMMTEETASGTEKAAEMAVLESEEGSIATTGAGGSGNGVSRRKLESRRKLMAAARKLFVERGYHDTRPQDISKEAGVGHGTFYLHFEDKLDCFLAFTDEAANELEAVLSKHLENAGTIEDVIREILSGTYEYSEEHPGVLAAALTDVTVLSKGDTGRKTAAVRWAEGWANLIDGWKKTKSIALDIDSKLAGHVLVGATKQAGGYASRAHLDHDFYIDNLTRLFVRALKAQ